MFVRILVAGGGRREGVEDAHLSLGGSIYSSEEGEEISSAPIQVIATPGQQAADTHC